MTRADTIAILFAVLLLPVLYVQLWQNDRQATHASITDAQQHITIAELNQPHEYHIKGILGESIVTVKDGKIRFTKSPCKGKVCVHRGWMKYSGEVMACLPNKVVVSLTGGEQKYDSINY